MVPSVVFSVTVLRISSGVAFRNGCTFFFSIVILRMRTGLSAKPFSPAGTCEIRSTTSIPSVTRPKAENCPSSGGCGATQMKNWLPSLFGLSGMRTVETTPRSCFRSLNSPGSRFRPPVPQRFFGVFGFFQQRVAALDDSVGDDAVEGAAVVIALRARAG